MRTNKFTPFLIALMIHLLPLFFILVKKPAIIQSNSKSLNFTTIDLNTFSIASKAKTKQVEASQIHTKSVSFPMIQENMPGVAINTYKTPSQGPQFSYFSPPQYPKIARLRGFEGKVKIKAFYDQVGSIEKVEIIESSGVQMLDEAVKKAALQWRLTSTMAGSFEKTFEFKLNN